MEAFGTGILGWRGFLRQDKVFVDRIFYGPPKGSKEGSFGVVQGQLHTVKDMIRAVERQLLGKDKGRKEGTFETG